MDSLADNHLTPDKPAEWGVYENKPVAQTQFETMVRATVAQMAEVQTRLEKQDKRPFIKDKVMAQWCLVDTGAAVTVVPKSYAKEPLVVDGKLLLKAVNGTTVRTYGRQPVKFVFGGAEFKLLQLCCR